VPQATGAPDFRGGAPRFNRVDPTTGPRRRRWLRRAALVLLGSWVVLTCTAQFYVAATDSPWPPPQGLRFVTTDGAPTRYLSWGPTTGPDVVLVHGAFESADTWRPVARLLAGRARVEAYDLFGYGYSARTGHYGPEALANQLAAFLAARHLRHPILVGHSLGAGVIARFVLDHPGVAAAVVFVDGDGLSLSFPGAAWLPRLVQEPYRSALFELVVRSDRILQGIWHSACGPNCPPLTASQLDQVRRPLLQPGAEQALLTIAAQPIVGVTVAQRARLHGTVTARVVWGSSDLNSISGNPFSTARALGAPPPTILAGTGHLSLWSDPAGVAAVIAELLPTPRTR